MNVPLHFRQIHAIFSTFRLNNIEALYLSLEECVCTVVTTNVSSLAMGHLHIYSPIESARSCMWGNVK